MKLIKVTDYLNETPCYINPKYISFICIYEGNTCIKFNYNVSDPNYHNQRKSACYIVKETIEEVIALIEGF